MKDFLAYLKVFLNPNDDVSLLRIANVPARGLSDATMERLLAASQERKCSVFGAMNNPAAQATFAAKTRASIEGFVKFVERTRAGLTESREHLPAQPNAEAGLCVPSAQFSDGSGLGAGGKRCPTLEPVRPFLQIWAEQFLREIGYLDELRRSEKEAEAAENRVRSLQDLIASMDDVEPLPPIDRLQVFLEELTLDTDREEENEPAGDAVTLITMHSCKGLEFPHVYIVGLEEGLLPHARSKAEGTLEEERRLFYVAITRAMRTLTLSYCRGRKKYGQLVPCHPSQFLKELPGELVEPADAKSKEPVTVESGKDFFAAMRALVD